MGTLLCLGNQIFLAFVHPLCPEQVHLTPCCPQRIVASKSITFICLIFLLSENLLGFPFTLLCIDDVIQIHLF